MKINKSIARFLILATIAGTTACTDKYEDYNTDTSGATQEEVEQDGYNLISALTGMQDYVIPLKEHTCQFTDCLLGGSFGGYLADSNNGFNGKNFSTYNPEEAWLRVPFNDIIPEIFIRHTSIRNITEDPVPIAVSDIIKVMGISRITDIYGPIPYSKLGADGQLNAPYDSQEQVYTKMFEELDEAISILTAHRTENFSANTDNVYGGNVEKWIKLGNTLKLRMAIRIAYVKPELAKTKAEEAANHVVGTMSSNDDNAFASVVGKNPFSIIVNEWNDSRVSADITSYMNGYNDPRREKYFTPTAFTQANITNGYFGLRSGIEIPGGTDIKLYSNMKVATNSKVMWMNAAEAAFLKAEGALRGWNMGGTPQAFYEKGITLSFDQWQAGGVSQYLSDDSSRPDIYKDPLKAYSYNGTSSSIAIKWDPLADTEKNLERIITQKWIANFPLGIEAWSEFRRTGYPKLMKVVKNNSGGRVNDDKMARRLPYPQDEYTENGENLQIAISQYLKGSDDMGTDVWWAKK